MRGKLIVIEGTDCSGKQTQTEMIIERLKKENIKIERLYFPRYDTPSGRIIGGPYLGKKHINEGWFSEGAANVDAKVACLYYAADRRYNLPEINKLLDSGINVILDRYSSSNMAHHGGKLTNKEERYKFYEFIDELEFKWLELPRPDMTILLYMPHQYSLMLNSKRKEDADEHEKVENHIISAENAYLELAELYKYKIINCIKDNQIRTREDINDELYDLLKKEI